MRRWTNCPTISVPSLSLTVGTCGAQKTEKPLTKTNTNKPATIDRPIKSPTLVNQTHGSPLGVALSEVEEAMFSSFYSAP